MANGGNNPQRNILEDLCRQASNEMDSQKLNLLIEQIDRLLDEQLKAQKLRRAA
jgi:hypothetical protein